MIIARIASLLIGYIFGLFQTAYIYGKSKGIDIRKEGSGNAGTTNSLRVLGWKAGAVTFLGDLFKAIFAVLLIKLIFTNTYADATKVLELYAGFGSVLGHNFPFYLQFKGGKGIACTSGAILAVACGSNLSDFIYSCSGNHKICIVRFHPCCDKLSDSGNCIRTAWISAP